MFKMLIILFLLGDTVIVKINGVLRIAVIKEIIRGKYKLERATPEELAHLPLSLKEVNTVTPPDFQTPLDRRGWRNPNS